MARMTPQNGNPVSRRRRKNGVFNKYLRAKYIDTQMKRFFKDNMAKSSFKKKRKIKESSFSGLPSAETKEKKLRWSSFCGSYVFVFLLGGLRFRNNLLRTDEFPFFVCVKTVGLLTGLFSETNSTTTTFMCKESSSFSGLPSAETKEKTLRWFSFWRANVFVFVLGNLRFRNNLFRAYVVS